MNTLASHSQSSRSAEVMDLVEQLTARIQSGEHVDLDAFLVEHVEHADEIRRLLPALALLVDLSRSATTGQVVPGQAVLGELGDFQIIRELGRGGMGVVYEATQLSLNRRVALKVLPFAATMDPKHLQRFRNEAMAAASLRHENIVHVYGVGCERSVHFYAMEMIDGQTLAQIIAGLHQKPIPKDVTSDFQPADAAAPTAPAGALSTEFSGIKGRELHRLAARLMADAADALEHAHSLGIVHRDIKPGNLMVDAAGKIYVTDFGLARFGPDAGLTMSGDLLGTLRYMSPEQAMARHGLVDHRTDIYSLGATLYELLTGRPAVGGDDKQEVLKHIAFEDPIPLRKIDRSIPVELETIVLKCLAKEPGERYGTAREVANDLRHWLQDKPLQAQPPTYLNQLRKWTVRHRALVTSSIILLAVAVAVLSAGTVVLWQEKDRTNTALKQAETNLSKAREVVDEMYTRVARQWLEDEPKMSDVQRDFVMKALRFYEDFANQDGREQAAVLDRARAYRRVGEIQKSLGKHSDAEAAFANVISLLEGLPSPSPDEISELASTLGLRGVSLSNRNRQAEAEQDFRRAIGLGESVPSNPERLYLIAQFRSALGAVLMRSDRTPEAIAVLGESASSLRNLTADFPKESNYVSQLGATLGNLAIGHSIVGNLRKSSEIVQEAIRHRETAARLNPRSAGHRLSVLKGYTTLAGIQRRLGALPDAIVAGRHALQLSVQLEADFPDRALYKIQVLDTAVELGKALVDTDRAEDRPDAEKVYRLALEYVERIRAQSPEAFVAPHRLLEADAHAGLGSLDDRKGQLQDAVGHYRQALTLDPKSKASNNNLVWLLARGADPDFRDTAELVRLARIATELMPKQSLPWATLGLAHIKSADWAAARTALDKSIALNSKENSPAWFLMAWVLAKTGQPAEARDWNQRAIEWMDKNEPNDADLGFLRAEVATLLQSSPYSADANEPATCSKPNDKPPK